MGKKSRRERQPQAASTAPAWAGANGFDQALRLTTRYVEAGNAVWDPAIEDDKERSVEELMSGKRLLDVGIAMSETQLRLLKSMMKTYHGLDSAVPNANEKVVTYLDEQTPEGWLNGRVNAEQLGPIMGILGGDHQKLLEQTTPLLFDPFMSPALERDQLTSLHLPFPVVTCDFLGDNGMCMPVHADEADNQWIGLVCATIAEPHPGVFDIWPVVTALDPEVSEYRQKIEPFLMGFVRVGENAPLPTPPEGIVCTTLSEWTINKDSDETLPAQVWIMETQHRGEISIKNNKDEDRWNDIWAGVLVLQPAIAALGALTLLDAINVDIEDADVPRAERRRAMQRHGQFKPAKEVIIRHRHSKREEEGSDSSSSIDWQHRWTVRGHWKHFTKGQMFEKNPRKRVQDATHGECVRIWCPPFVKGPEGKPLVLKSRRIVA